MSNRGELSSRNCAAIDFPKVPSEAQAIVGKYLQSQKDLADRAKKKYTDCHSVQEAASDKCNERSVLLPQGNEATIQRRMEKARQITSRILGIWTTMQQWKSSWLGKMIMNGNATTKKENG